MAQFELTDKDGKIYDVDAPDAQSAYSAFQKMQGAGMRDPGIGQSADRINAPPKQPSGFLDTAKDVAQSAGSGLVRGAVGVATFPSTIKSLAEEKLIDPALGKLGEWVSGHPAAPETLAARDRGKSMAITSNAMKAGTDAANSAMDATLHKPETTAGQYAETVGSFVPGAAMGGGNVIANALRYAVPAGVASEAAGQATKGTKFEPWARAAGGLAGGLPGLLTRPGSGQRMAGRSVAGVTDAQFAEARALAERSTAAGMPITADEAIQAVTGGAGRVGEVRRIVESTERGGNVLSPMMSARPAQADNLARQNFDRIAAPNPEMSHQGTLLQGGAEDVINNARRANNAAAQPYYDALRGQQMPAADYARVAANQSYAAALRDLRNNPELAFRYARLPDNDLSVVNAVVKRLDAMAEDARPSPLVRGGDNEMVAARTAARADADIAASAASPDYRTARDIVRQGNETIVDPLRSGPVGKIAATPLPDQQASALLNAPATREASQATRDLMTTAPGPTQSVVRRGVEEPYNRAVRGDPNTPLNAGPDSSFNAARYVRSMRDDPQKAANTLAAIEASAGPNAAQAFREMLDTFGATGWRMRPGSKTAFNDIAMEELARGGPQSIGAAVANPFGAARDWFQKARLGRQSQTLAEILASGPQGIDRLQRLARQGDTGAQDALIRALAGVADPLSRVDHPRLAR